MSTLFISHSSQDVAWCQCFVAGLRAAGHTCFFDHDSIPGSAEWLDTIEKGVQQSHWAYPYKSNSCDLGKTRSLV